jgi:hypothetical protein
MSTEHNTCGVFAVLLFLDFKFVNDLKNTKTLKMHVL